jgi:hypothetical protein
MHYFIVRNNLLANFLPETKKGTPMKSNQGKMNLVNTTLVALAILTPAFASASLSQIHCEVDEAQTGTGTPSSPLMGYKAVLNYDTALAPSKLPPGYPEFMVTGGKGFTVEDGTSYELLISADTKASSATDPGSASLFVEVAYTSTQATTIPANTNLVLAARAAAEGSPTSLMAVAGVDGSSTIVFNHELKATCTLK